ncbi:MAG: peptide deformylase [Saprospiraceae bacterium]|nr:peptide deformylase [Saprospiraceae bacterium]
MILPIYAYGQPVLKKVAEDIAPEYPNLKEFIQNMWDTMYDAHGVGLAAPQVGASIRLFIIDSEQIEKEDEPTHVGFKRVFINAHKVEETGNRWSYEEGCLSIPNIRGEVMRKSVLTLRYMDENFEERTETFSGVNARVIQHEYDHIDGILFTEYLSPVKRTLIKGKLENIRRGKTKAEYKMKFVPK